MNKKVLYEISRFCMECKNRESCIEEECVLFRIEKIVSSKKEAKRSKNKNYEK